MSSFATTERALESTSLSGAERRALLRFVDELRARLGPDLRAVWLYGSRARGEPPSHEDSDVDVFVVAPADELPGKVIASALQRAASANRVNPWSFSVRRYEPQQVARGRAIGNFYFAEVDRDRVVLGGEDPLLAHLPEVDASTIDQRPVRDRTLEFLEQADELLDAARLLTAENHPSSALGEAYYAALNVARAGLSEIDRYAKTHKGIWHLFHQSFVVPGHVDPGLHRAVAALQKPREYAVYYAVPVTEQDATTAVAAAERFLDAVRRLLT